METCFQTIRIVAGRGEQEGEREEENPPPFYFSATNPHLNIFPLIQFLKEKRHAVTKISNTSLKNLLSPILNQVPSCVNG